jgi:site-specific DNA-methyltransferase (cytosine-N4-specific)
LWPKGEHAYTLCQSLSAQPVQRQEGDTAMQGKNAPATKRRARQHSVAAAPFELYRTPLGRAVVGRAEEYLLTLPENSLDLIMTSPPFALLREKAYGNLAQDAYVDWLVSFGPLVRRVLKDTGSFVLDLGGAYQRGRPVRSLCNFRVLLRLCDECGFFLAEEFFWYNPAKLPSPIEWVNKRKIRAKDAVNTVWWLSRTEFPKADVRNVRIAYSARMRKLFADPSKFCEPTERPSGHGIGYNFARDNGGAIPSNLLRYPNTESNSLYLRLCKGLSIRGHPARYPEALPEFFIRFLTEPGDAVADIFAGSNTTGAVAERLGRTWLAVECDRDYAAASAFRFLADWSDGAVKEFFNELMHGSVLPLEVRSEWWQSFRRRKMAA